MHTCRDSSDETYNVDCVTMHSRQDTNAFNLAHSSETQNKAMNAKSWALGKAVVTRSRVKKCEQSEHARHPRYNASGSDTVHLLNDIP